MNKPDFILLPTFLTDEPELLVKNLARLPNSIKRIQIDVMDGEFVPVKTLSIEQLGEIKQLKDFEIDLHLMVANPIVHLNLMSKLGFKMAVVQAEALNDQLKFVHQAYDLGLKIGLALDIDTEVEDLQPGLISTLDQILLMAVKVGYSGQKFNSRVIEKIKKIRQLAGDELDICVDGGINDQTAGPAVAAGANLLAVNSFLWNGDVGEQLKKLQTSMFKINSK